nr:aldos-2-ulose dehydratase [Phanerodontia chrysosporium]
MYSKVFLKPHCEPEQPAALPLFQPQLVQGGRPDGYWVEAFPFRSDSSKCPNIIGYGLGTYDMKSDIQMFVNPYATTNNQSSSWTPVSLAKLDFPVAMHYADITKNGFNDVIITDQYGSSMDDIWAYGGRVSWLENPGELRDNWTMRTIGHSPGMHRLKAGHFTRTDRVQVVAVPIVVASSDLTTPADVIIFTAPDDPRSEQLWQRDVVGTRHLVHEVAIVPAAETDGEMRFDQIILAGRDGVDCLWYDGARWQKHLVGTGLPEERGDPYWGAGSAAVGRVGDDYAGYICSAEAFHGNTVSVYTKPAGSPTGIVRAEWTRHVLDVFGPLNGKHTGSIHQVVCADIDGDGEDEFLVAMMGADPPDFQRTGVWCYKLVDRTNMKFSKTKVSSVSAGRIATANFHSQGSEVDIATISYSVPGYFESPNPSINVFLSTGILAERLDEEVMLRVVRAGSTRFKTEMEFLDVAGKKLTLVVLPPFARLDVERNVSGVKVMAGTVCWADENGKHERVPATRPFGCESMIVSADYLESGEEGAILVLYKPSSTSGRPPFRSMDELVAHNLFPAYVPDSVRAMKFPWVRCADRPWAHGRFKDLDFFNLIGFHVNFADDSAAVLAHVQLWTAGIGVSAGFHNHVEASFCEIHACIANGTGRGGMRWATVPDANFNPDSPNLEDTELIVVPDMHEHGPLWRTRPDGHPLLRMNDTIDYPWHAWLAGAGNPSPQAFDVWVAFEFPGFETFSTPPPPRVLEPGRYAIRFGDPHQTASLALQKNDATDGTPVLALLDLDGGPSPQAWNISHVPGTDMYEIAHAKTGSLVCARWPPVKNQRVAGTHSPAAMGLTSRWAVTKNTKGQITFRLPEAPDHGPLFLSVSAIRHQQGADAIPVIVQGDSIELSAWSLVPAN